MKKSILIFFAFLAMAQSSIAQTTDMVTFQITISNSNAISHFKNAGLYILNISGIQPSSQQIKIIKQ